MSNPETDDYTPTPLEDAVLTLLEDAEVPTKFRDRIIAVLHEWYRGPQPVSEECLCSGYGCIHDQAARAASRRLQGRVKDDLPEESRRWLDIERHVVKRAIDNSVSHEQLGRMLRSYMALPDCPPFTAETTGD